jgi:hypothetical protein
MEEKKVIAVDIISQAVSDNDVPKYYFNGFTNGVGNSDIVIVLQSNNKPIALLNTSFTIAKTLVKKLNESIQLIEKSSGNVIMTTEDLDKAFQKSEK